MKLIRNILALSNDFVFDSEFISPTGHLYSLVGSGPLFTPVSGKEPYEADDKP